MFHVMHTDTAPCRIQSRFDGHHKRVASNKSGLKPASFQSQRTQAPAPSERQVSSPRPDKEALAPREFPGKLCHGVSYSHTSLVPVLQNVFPLKSQSQLTRGNNTQQPVLVMFLSVQLFVCVTQWRRLHNVTEGEWR